MQKSLAGWMQAKLALEKLEDSCINDLKDTTTSAEDRIEALTTLLSISNEPFVGSDFSFRVAKKGVFPLIKSVLEARVQAEVLPAVQILRRVTADDVGLCQELLSLGICGPLVLALETELSARPEDTDSIFASDEMRSQFQKHLEAEKVDDHKEEQSQYKDGGAVTFQKSAPAPAASAAAEDSDEAEELPPAEPIDDSSRIVRSVLLVLWQLATLYEGRQIITTGRLTSTIVRVLAREKGTIRKFAVRVLLHLAEDIFTRSSLRATLFFTLGLGGFEAAKGRILNANDPEELKWFSEICKHLELFTNLKKDGKAWYPIEEFPFVKMIEEAFPAILAEFRQLQASNLVAWPEKYLCQKGWDVFPFYAFKNKMQKNCDLCPKTTAVLEAVPGMLTAMFSCLAPRTHIKPHIGYQQYSERMLRCHLGVDVPEGCFLKVNWEDHTWEEGKCFVFDDTFRHEAWNSSERQRVVLMIDFYYPGKSSNRNPDFVKQMGQEGMGQGDDALISKDLLEAIKQFGDAQNISEGRQEKFQ